MKRSEMVEHITAEILNAVKDRQHSNETEEKYYARKAEGILDMMLGFGMEPPTVYTNNKEEADLELGVSFATDKPYIKYLTKWEPESET